MGNHPTLSLRDLYFRMIDLLGDQLVRLGVARNHEEKRGSYIHILPNFDTNTTPLYLNVNKTSVLADKLCPHHVSHYQGLDVHDTETISKCIPLQPGVVITIEPGLYFPANMSGFCVPERFRGLGLRIEDDVLVTETGVENLTGSCAKRVEDIERIVQSADWLSDF